MLLLIVYAIVGTVLTVLSVIAALAVIKTYRLLSEIIESGAIPVVLVMRARRDADKILAAGFISDLWKFEETCRILKEVDGSLEAVQLAHQLEQLKAAETL